MELTYQNWTIRRITAGDVSRTLAFLIPMLQAVYPNIPDVTIRWDLSHMAEAYTVDARAAMFAAFDPDGKVVGTIAIQPYDDRIEFVQGCYDPDKTAELSRCYVAGSLRRQGIAGKLVMAVEDYCRQVGYTAICLHTHRFLPGGYPFWLSRQYKNRVIGNDPLDTVYMDKDLYGPAEAIDIK
jgi:GNAT superfamily N-acetyltransferase